MVTLNKEAAMQVSSTLRILVATAVVSALAILMTSPAQAYFVNEGGDVSVTAPVVGNPGDGAQVPTPVVGNAGDGAQVPAAHFGSATAVTTSSASDGSDFLVAAGGVVLVLALGAGALLITARYRKVALP